MRIHDSHGGDMPDRLSLALALVSAAILGLQIVLMQLLSFAQWHHFAYMIVSVALLAFGISGTVLALWRGWFQKDRPWILPAVLTLCACSTAWTPWLLASPALAFDSYRVFVELSHARRLAATYAVLLLPFLSGAMAIGIVFVRDHPRIGSLYFWNLAGSAAGVVIPLILLEHVFPERLAGGLSLLPLAAAMLVSAPQGVRLPSWSGLFLPGFIVCVLLSPPRPAPSEYKSLSRALALPGASVLVERPSAQGIVHVVSAPALRYAPGVSLTFAGEAPGGTALFVDGEMAGPVVGARDPRVRDVLDHSSQAAPYSIRSPERVLILRGGTGPLAAHALERGASHVTLLEPHGGIVSLMQADLAERTDSLFRHPAVSVRTEEARSYLRSSDQLYDLILLPPVDAFGGTAGAYAMREQYDLTTEGFRAMIRRLSPAGVLSVSSWLDAPLRNPLRLLATLVEASGAELGVPPTRHVLAVQSWGMITFLVLKSPVTDGDLARLRRFAAGLRFDPVIAPGVAPAERQRYNRTDDASYLTSLDLLMSAARDSFCRSYEYDIVPATDDRPYFSQYLRGAGLGRAFREFGGRSLPFLELGYFILLVTCVQILAASLLLGAAPVVLGSVRGPRVAWTFTYFAGIGLGFIAMEMALIQASVRLLGHPLHAAAATMGGLLTGAGLGSLLSRRFRSDRRSLIAGILAVAAGIGAANLLLVPALAAVVPASRVMAFVLTIAGIGLVGVPMGLPFPLGLRVLAAENDRLIPWAWGVNGSASVMGAVLATLIGVEAGFVAVVGVAAAAYLLAAGACVLSDRGPGAAGGWWRTGPDNV